MNGYRKIHLMIHTWHHFFSIYILYRHTHTHLVDVYVYSEIQLCELKIMFIFFIYIVGFFFSPNYFRQMAKLTI